MSIKKDRGNGIRNDLFQIWEKKLFFVDCYKCKPMMCKYMCSLCLLSPNLLSGFRGVAI